MKRKILKILFCIVLIMSVFINVQAVQADSTVKGLDETIDDANSFVGLGSDFEMSSISEVSDLAYWVLVSIGGVVALGVGVFLGVKYMISTVDEKADIKKSLVAYVVGCVVIFGAFGIWKIVINMGNNIF